MNKGNRTRTKGTTAPLETDPERIALMMDMLRAVVDVGGETVQGALGQLEQMRELSSRLRLPFAAIYLHNYEDCLDALHAEDIAEWQQWRAAIASKGGAR